VQKQQGKIYLVAKFFNLRNIQMQSQKTEMLSGLKLQTTAESALCSLNNHTVFFPDGLCCHSRNVATWASTETVWPDYYYLSKWFLHQNRIFR